MASCTGSEQQSWEGMQSLAAKPGTLSFRTHHTSQLRHSSRRSSRSLFSLSFSFEARLTVIDSAYLHPPSIGSGKPFPDGPCSAGYYCPPGQTSATPTSFRCPRGFYCPEGSPQPRACENGTFQPQEAKGSCEPCPAGFYCEASGTGELMNTRSPYGAGSQGKIPVV